MGTILGILFCVMLFIYFITKFVLIWVGSKEGCLMEFISIGIALFVGLWLFCVL